MRSTNDPVFLTTAQAAERYKVSIATIRRWSRLGKIPARKIGRKYHINTEALDAFLGRAAS